MGRPERAAEAGGRRRPGSRRSRGGPQGTSAGWKRSSARWPKKSVSIPTLPATAFDRFVRLCSDWDQARARHAEQRARVADLDQQLAAIARETGKFLDAWPRRAGVGGAGDAGSANDADGSAAETRPDLELLRSRLDHLDQRVTAANDARRVIEDRAREIESLRRDIKKVEEASRQVYTATGIEPGDRAALTERLDQWPGWKAAKRALDETATAERLAREDLAGQADLIARADAGKRAQAPGGSRRRSRQGG